MIYPWIIFIIIKAKLAKYRIVKGGGVAYGVSVEIFILKDIAMSMKCTLLFWLIAVCPACFGQNGSMVLHPRAGLCDFTML